MQYTFITLYFAFFTLAITTEQWLTQGQVILIQQLRKWWQIWYLFLLTNIIKIPFFLFCKCYHGIFLLLLGQIIFVVVSVHHCRELMRTLKIWKGYVIFSWDIYTSETCLKKPNQRNVWRFLKKDFTEICQFCGSLKEMHMWIPKTF